MDLIDKFEEIFLEQFDSLDTIAGAENYMKQNKKGIKFLCEHNNEISEYVEEYVGRLIIKEAREKYFERLTKGFNPEGLPYPEYLAYAFLNNSFSYYELRKINFENDNIRNAFIKKYSDTKLLKNFLERIFSP